MAVNILGKRTIYWFDPQVMSTSLRAAIWLCGAALHL